MKTQCKGCYALDYLGMTQTIGCDLGVPTDNQGDGQFTTRQCPKPLDYEQYKAVIRERYTQITESITEPTVCIKFAWYDIWVGAYYDRSGGYLYICPIPMVAIRIKITKGTQ